MFSEHWWSFEVAKNHYTGILKALQHMIKLHFVASVLFLNQHLVKYLGKEDLFKEHSMHSITRNWTHVEKQILIN